MARQPEAKLQRHIQDLFKRAGGCCFKIHGGDPFQAAGIPDLLCCIAGRFVGAEIKMPGELLRPMQRVALREIYSANGIAAVLETTRQASSLLAYIEDWSTNEAMQSVGVCFDRGTIHYEFRLC